MRNFRFYIFIALVAITTVFIYSCAKDDDKNPIAEQAKTQSLENRFTNNSACSPQSMFTEYVGCTHQQITRPISFASGLGIWQMHF